MNNKTGVKLINKHFRWWAQLISTWLSPRSINKWRTRSLGNQSLLRTLRSITSWSTNLYFSLKSWKHSRLGRKSIKWKKINVINSTQLYVRRSHIRGKMLLWIVDFQTLIPLNNSPNSRRALSWTKKVPEKPKKIPRWLFSMTKSTLSQLIKRCPDKSKKSQVKRSCYSTVIYNIWLPTSKMTIVYHTSGLSSTS